MKMTVLKRANGQPVVAGPLAGWFDNLFTQHPLDQLFQDSFPEEWAGFSANPPVNIQEITDGYVLELAAPGLEKTDFQINLEGDLLTISAEKKEEKTADQSNSVRREFNFKSFKRSFTLDEKVDAGRIAASYENGVLKLTLPKKDKPAESGKTIPVA
ncbi:MAG TPA: Hsp20/alpha crystallin family protein [Chitinophagaceae bacterium]|nr:Hsp20/alpha crystallin family protein [Chitinophagaceae bacterium]